MERFLCAMYLLAYGRIYANKGAMTPGVTQDGMQALLGALGLIGAWLDLPRDWATSTTG
ncbi:hypothetical protein [Nocardia yunnanensis]|uniref:hypothetical protein n=1 Tax=Nocardia yunnanensis TaxID=2382165 RepID=UPI00165736BF|nr:hypothetical protein [Nocardia yunnanensis]